MEVHGATWSCEGRIIKVPDSMHYYILYILNPNISIKNLIRLEYSDDFTIGMFSSSNKIPIDKKTNYVNMYGIQQALTGKIFLNSAQIY